MMPDKNPNFDKEQPIFQIVEPGKDELQQHSYAVVVSPGEHGHPESKEIAKGAHYMGGAFRSLLQRVDVEHSTETVQVPRRHSRPVEIMQDTFQSALTRLGLRKAKETDQLYHFDEFREATAKDYEVTLRHLEAGERVLHAGPSHDATGRVLACKKANPNAIILHFDKHPDAQKPSSGDSPGKDRNQVRGHASWVTTAMGNGGPVLDQICPEGSPRLERRDVFQAGIMHPDMSEAYEVAGIDPNTQEQVAEPIPYATWDQINGTAKGPNKRKENESRFHYTTTKLREWIDERKQRYGVESIEIGIEDDPDSARFEDIGKGNTMGSPRGFSAELKYDILRWLSQQGDVQVVYYGTCEVKPQNDEGHKIQIAIQQWAAASFGWGDPVYNHGGYAADMPDERTNLYAGLNTNTATGRMIAHTLTAVAASVLAVLGTVRMIGTDAPSGMDSQLSSWNESGDFDPSSSRAQLQAKADFLGLFSQSGFREDAARLRYAVEMEDTAAQSEAMESLVQSYQTATAAAPDDATIQDIGRVALSEFNEGFGETGDFYQQFREGTQRDNG